MKNRPSSHGLAGIESLARGPFPEFEGEYNEGLTAPSMSTSFIFMSNSSPIRINVGAYQSPFSGVGIEFDPLGTAPDRTGVILHESGYLPANSDWNFPSVFSPFWRLYYNGASGHCIWMDDQMVELTPDRMVLIPRHRHFHCLGAQAAPSFWLTFSLSQDVSKDQELPIILAPRDTELCLIRDIQELILRDETYDPLPEIYRFSLALLHITISRPEIRWQPAAPAQLQKALAHIEGHLGKPISNHELAHAAGMSLMGLIRAFRMYCGTTPAHYVSQVRVREASLLLLRTKRSLDDIAESTGFPDRSYFSRVFKKHTGTSPAAFRRGHIPLDALAAHPDRSLGAYLTRPRP